MIAKQLQLARIRRLAKRLQLVETQASQAPPPLRALSLACDMAVTSQRLRVAVEHFLTSCEVELAKASNDNAMMCEIEVVGL